MASASTGGRTVRLKDIDWDILEVMSDGRRYTPVYLYRSVPELDDYGDDWIRRRITDLAGADLVENVCDTSMYEITDWGIAALTLQDELDEADPTRAIQKVMERADDLDVRRRDTVIEYDE